MTLRSLAAVSAMLLALAGGATAQRPPPPPGQTPSFSLVNRTTSVIRELFATPSGSANWGQNRLDGRNGNPASLAPGASYTVRRRTDTACNFDLRVVFADGKTEDRKGVNVCAIEEVTIGTAPAGVDAATGKAADDASFRLFNRAAVAVTEVYATPAGLGNWGKNRLDLEPLAPDNRRSFSLPRDGNCIYDMRVVFADKRTMERKRVNLCRVAELPVP